MKILTIDTGYFYADGGAMFGAIPKTSWSRRYPSNAQNGCVLAMRSLLIEADGRIILVDNGAGYKHLKALSYYQFFDLQDLHEALRKRGIEPTDVTDMVFTHLHFDHCGYTTLQDPQSDTLRLAFPNANHWVSRRQWENFRQPHPLEQGSYFPEDMELVETSGRLRLVEEEEMALTPHVRFRLFDGHTPGQIALYCDLPERTYLFAGDVIPLAAHLSLAWISAYDDAPLRSYEAKERMLAEAVAHKQAIIYCHDAHTCCSTVKRINHFYSKDASLTLG
ncbi:MAG: MBL fold metallo-hydrolase [bacterium]|nr:MBL fold metallo-hydrolase [bacterium]